MTPDQFSELQKSLAIWAFMTTALLTAIAVGIWFD